MPDQGIVFPGIFDGENVEAAGDLDPFGVFGQETESDLSDLAALGRYDGFLGESAIVDGPGFDFDEDQGRAVPGNDVDFPPAEPISSFDDAEAFPEKIADGGVLAAAA